MTNFNEQRQEQKQKQAKPEVRFKWLKRLGIFIAGALFMQIGWYFETTERQRTNNLSTNLYFSILANNIERFRIEPNSDNAGKLIHSISMKQQIEKKLSNTTPALLRSKEIKEVIEVLSSPSYQFKDRKFDLQADKLHMDGPPFSDEEIQGLLQALKSQALVIKINNANALVSFTDSKK